MSQDDLAIAKRALDAFNRGDLDAFFLDLTEDAEFEEDGAFPEAAVFRGREKIAGYIRAFQATWS